MARMLPREAENGVGMNRSASGEESVKRFERSNGLDTALYKTIPFFLPERNSGPIILRIRGTFQGIAYLPSH